MRESLRKILSGQYEGREVVTGAEETMELATEEEPAEEVTKGPDMAVALLLVSHPERKTS